MSGRAGLALRLLAVDLGLRLFGFARVRRRLGRAPARPVALDPAAADDARRLAAAVARAAGFRVYRVGCLPRALLLQRLLARRGLASELRVGVRREPGRVAAHAWFECHGLCLDPEAAAPAGFAPLG